MKKYILFLILAAIIFTSCTKTEEDKIAVIWTDRAEFVSYCEVFNNSQSEHKIIVEYKKNPVDALINTEVQPDIVIGAWLKGKSARVKFRKINNLFGEKKNKQERFLSRALKLGKYFGQSISIAYKL
nr:hypothetical protein [Treponema sp. OMZ 798]